MWLATVTPLASIFGSGFLIIIPILERELGALAVVGMAGVCLVAWMVGIAIRHNVAVVEPLAHDGRLDPTTSRIDRASDLVIVVERVASEPSRVFTRQGLMADVWGYSAGRTRTLDSHVISTTFAGCVRSWPTPPTS